SWRLLPGARRRARRWGILARGSAGDGSPARLLGGELGQARPRRQVAVEQGLGAGDVVGEARVQVLELAAREARARAAGGLVGGEGQAVAVPLEPVALVDRLLAHRARDRQVEERKALLHEAGGRLEQVVEE